MINFPSMHGFVPDCENCLSGWARCLRTWHLHLQLQLRAGYPQPVRLQGPYATDGEDAHVSRAGLHRGIRLWAQAPGILHGSPQAQLHDQPGSPHVSLTLNSEEEMGVASLRPNGSSPRWKLQIATLVVSSPLSLTRAQPQHLARCNNAIGSW